MKTTIGEYIAEKLGGVPPGQVPCPGCHQRLPLFAIVQAAPSRWRCGNCLLGDERDAVAPYVLTWEDIRGERAVALARSDWTQLPDIPEDTALLWRPYRQAWRDIPLQGCAPADVQRPQPPQTT